MKHVDNRSESNESSSQDFKSSCEHHEGVFITKQHVGPVVAAGLVLGCFIFIGGYFWGQRTAADQLLGNVEQESFADQVYYSLCSMYGTDMKDDEEEDADTDGDASTESSDEDKKVEEGEAQESSPVAQVKKASDGVIGASIAVAKVQPTQKYCAQLVGFGNQRDADRFVQRLAQKNIVVVSQKRISKTPRGRTIVWYQVSTSDYAQRGELEKVIAAIKNYEKIHDVRVVEHVA